MKLALIYGSTREGRFCDVVARWALTQLGEHEVTVVDPRQPVEVAQLQEADAFLVLTPEYNHSFPAPLKNLIDSFGSPWRVKPVAFISYGGISGGIRAVEQLRQIFVELHAVCIRSSVAFANAWEHFDEQGNLRQPERSQGSLQKLLRQLQWWSEALRAARLQGQPFEQVA